MSDRKTPATTGETEYDDEVLNAGWVTPPDGMATTAASEVPGAARNRVEDFLDIVYRSQGSDIE